MKSLLLGCALSLVAAGAWAQSVMYLPMSCDELLPDTAAFLNFFQVTARYLSSTNRSLSGRMYQLLELRDLYIEKNRGADAPLVDSLIRRTLCFFRVGKDAAASIAYNDPDLAKFLNENLSQLRDRIQNAILVAEQQRQQEKELEALMGKGENTADAVKAQAQREARETYRKLEKRAGSRK